MCLRATTRRRVLLQEVVSAVGHWRLVPAQLVAIGRGPFQPKVVQPLGLVFRQGNV